METTHGAAGIEIELHGFSECLRKALAQAAREEDAGRSIDDSIGRLKSLGWVAAARSVRQGGTGLGRGGLHAGSSVHALLELAELNLPLARLFEGHVNALWLLDAYAAPALAREAAVLAGDGALFGVWGADGDPPLAWDASRQALDGSKRFASGLGSVARAVVTARTGDGSQQLCLVDVTDPARCDASAWDMSGMRATCSGTFDFSGMDASTAQAFGAPNDYGREPGLVSGVWRIAALQLGGTYGLLEAVRTALSARGRLDDDAQRARLVPLLWRAQAAIDLVVRAASLAESTAGACEPERAVALSLFARLSTEALAQDAIAAAERSVGLAHFASGSESGRIARDLATYIRQVSPDAFVQRAGRFSLESAGRLAALFDVRDERERSR